MYAYIKGELTEKSIEGIVVETGGVGYEILIPTVVLDRLPAIGSQVKIYTYLFVREDQMCLYGFASKEQQKFFLLLISVSGIGPKGALAILSAMDIGDLRFAILAGDVKTISKAPGVGKKTAERLVLELKDKIGIDTDYEDNGVSEAGAVLSSVNTAKQEAIAALLALGYSSAEATKAVYSVEDGDDDVESVLKKALKKMAFI